MPLPSTAPAPLIFSGHETFVLRSNWLKKAYDLLVVNPRLFFEEDAFVQLGVGKNMARVLTEIGPARALTEDRATQLGLPQHR